MNDAAQGTGEDKASSKETQIFLAVVSILLIGFLAFIFFGIDGKQAPQLETLEYNFFEFEQIGGMWETDIQLQNQLYRATFRFNPKQVEDVPVDGEFNGFDNSPIYITFDPQSDLESFKYQALAVSELSLNLIRALNYTVEAACTKNETDACFDRPIVDCGDANRSVIFISSKPPTQITLKDNCITLSGQDVDLIRSVDRLLYQWYKII